MTHGRERSDPATVALKPTNAAERSGAVLSPPKDGGAKGGDRGERETGRHAPDAEPGRRVTRPGSRTENGKGKEEG